MTRLISSLVLLGALTGCGFADADQAVPATPTPSASPGATRVEVAVLAPTDARIDVSLPGEVEGWRDALLASAMGGRVESVSVTNGQSVNKGQVLMRVDAKIHGAQQAQADARLLQARSDLRRVEALGDMASEADRERAATEVRVAEASLQLATAQLDQAVIRAPFDGVASAVDVEVGEYAPPGSPVMRLSQMDPVKVTLSVPDRDVVALQAGMPVRVGALSRSEPFVGVIDYVGAAADLNSRAFPVAVKVDNPDGLLLPGMIVRVDASRVVQEGVVTIPQEWVVYTRNDRGVFIETDGVAVWRPVSLGPVVRDQVVVTGGLAHGDRIVITGHRDLADGDALLVNREGICCEAGRVVFGGAASADGGGR